MPNSLTLGHRPKLFLEVKKAIEAYIEQAGLQAGDQLPPEPELCERFGVSRTALREALKVLEVLGAISVEPGRGTYLKRIDVTTVLGALPYTLMFRKDDFAEVIEVRRWLELFCVRRAAGAAGAGVETDLPTKSQTARLHADLEACLAEMTTRANAGESMWAEDVRFHRLLAEATDNRVLLLILEVFWNLRGKLPVDDSPAALKKRLARHRELYEAIVAGDVERAARALDDHFAGGYEETGLPNPGV